MIESKSSKVKEISMKMNQNILNILYEDSHILVCEKPSGTPTQSSRIGAPDMVSLIKNYLYRQNPDKGEPYLAVIHRLDQPVRGILVFAKTAFAAKELNKQLTSHGFGKYYRALVTGIPSKSEADVENYLVKDSRSNTSRICSANTNGAKKARLHYKTAADDARFFQIPESASAATELDIHLDTGRHHQIRVQMAGIGCPIVGDTKYNPNLSQAGKWQQICLCAYKLDFTHPKTKKNMHFELKA